MLVRAWELARDDRPSGLKVIAGNIGSINLIHELVGRELLRA